MKCPKPDLDISGAGKLGVKSFFEWGIAVGELGHVLHILFKVLYTWPKSIAIHKLYDLVLDLAFSCSTCINCLTWCFILSYASAGVKLPRESFQRASRDETGERMQKSTGIHKCSLQATDPEVMLDIHIMSVVKATPCVAGHMATMRH